MVESTHGKYIKLQFSCTLTTNMLVLTMVRKRYKSCSIFLCSQKYKRSISFNFIYWIQISWTIMLQTNLLNLLQCLGYSFTHVRMIVRGTKVGWGKFFNVCGSEPSQLLLQVKIFYEVISHNPSICNCLQCLTEVINFLHTH